MEWRVLASVNERLNCASAERRGDKSPVQTQVYCLFLRSSSAENRRIFKEAAFRFHGRSNLARAVSKGGSDVTGYGGKSPNFLAGSRGAQAVQRERQRLVVVAAVRLARRRTAIA